MATSSSTTSTAASAAGLRSQERFHDADEIESLLISSSSGIITRPSAKLHLENLVSKLRKEGQALQRVEESSAKAAAAAVASNEDHSSSIMELEEVDGPSMTTSSTSTTTTTTPSAPPAPATSSSSKKYHPFPTIQFDAGKYNSPVVTIYLPLPNIGHHDPSKISCTFTSSSIDIIVSDYTPTPTTTLSNNAAGNTTTTNTVSYRLLNNNLEKDIDVSTTKYSIKSNKIIVKLGKVKGEYGSYDTWTQLSSKKDKKSSSSTKDASNPAAGIMDLMKDMYDEGDDNMKKMIGETMYKQRMGQLNNNKDDMMGGMGGFGGMGDMMDM